jgi:hypothetical protein
VSGACGGGVVASGAGTQVTLTKMTVRDNQAESDTFAGGAGLANTQGSTMRVVRSRVIDNTSSAPQAYGGGILNVGTMIVERSTVSGNLADSTDDARGGGLHTFLGASRLTILDSTIAGNEARGQRLSFGGGVGTTDFAPVVIRRSTISGNEASGGAGNGGGIHAATGLVLTDSTVTGNEATQQHGGVSAGSGLTVKGSTIVRNSAPYLGGITWSGSATISATIVAENIITAIDADTPDCSAFEGSFSHVLVGNGTNCGGITDGVNGNIVGTVGDPVDPKLGPLAKNGGPTKTHALLAGSPARNAAGTAPCATKTDQRGTARPVGGACDIGGYEGAPG